MTPLVAPTHPALKAGTEKFDFSNPPVDPVVLYNQLGQAMIDHNGLGLAAPQMGLPYRFFVMRAEKVLGCYNPKIVHFSEETVILEEGCLTYPDLYVKVKRPRVIKTRFTLPSGETVTRQFQDITARIFQHELDHLDGICHLQRANKFHLEQAYRAKSRINKRASK
jgi:peptide deformylase